MNTEQLILAAQTFSGIPPDNHFVSYRSLGELLALRAREAPAARFLAYSDDDQGATCAYTHAEFDTLVNRFAAWLGSTLEIRRGDCVATLSWNHPLAAALLFACWRIGAVIAPQNVHEDDARMAFILRDARCKALLYLPPLHERAHAIARQAGEITHVLALVEPGLDGGAALVLPECDADLRAAPALLVYTSGTTGTPKGVLLTQYNILVNALGTQQWQQIDATQRLMCVLPIHHVNGIVVTLATPLLAGASVVLCKSFKASMLWKRLASERVAIVSVVPTLLQFLCEADEDISSLDLSRFRHFICGAGTLSIALAQRFEKQFGFPVLHGYGLSETTAYVCMLPVNLGAKEHARWLADFGYPSIGAAFPHVEMAIHDADGNVLTAGERGEIVVRGHYVMAGYYLRDNANAETFKHGWFRSGDEGFFANDEQGRAFYFITGRIKELINRGGVKYSPFEIEEVLLRIPGVKAGLAIAFENDWYGEEVGAYVVREDGATVTAEEILAICRNTMPFAKSPKVVVFGGEVPVTVTGKYQRLKLKPLFADYTKTQFRPRHDNG
jgi:long-chain acyl-CoA synthetase